MRGQGNIYKRGRVWWIRYHHRGKEYRESSKSEKEGVAKRLLKKRLGELHSGTFVGPAAERVTLEKLLEDLELDYQNNGRKNLPSLKGYLKHIRAFFVNDRAIDVTESRLERYKAHRLEAEAAPASVNRELAALRRALNLAKKRKLINSVPTFELLKERNVREGFIERADFEALAKELPEPLEDFCRFLFLSAWRKSEAASLTWGQVDLQEKLLWLRSEDSKNGRGRTLALEGALLDLVKKRRTLRKVERKDGTVELSAHVFHDGRGREVGDFRKAWKSATTKAGFPHLLVHDLRRSGVRAMVRGGTPERIAMAISGHRSRHIFDRYDITSESDIRAAVKRTSAYIEAQPLERKVEQLDQEATA